MDRDRTHPALNRDPGHDVDRHHRDADRYSEQHLPVLASESGPASWPVLDVDQTGVAAVVLQPASDLVLVPVLEHPCVVLVLVLHVLLDVGRHRVLDAYPVAERTGCFPDVVPHREGQAVALWCLLWTGTDCSQAVEQPVSALVLGQALELV